MFIEIIASKDLGTDDAWMAKIDSMVEQLQSLPALQGEVSVLNPLFAQRELITFMDDRPNEYNPEAMRLSAYLPLGGNRQHIQLASKNAEVHVIAINFGAALLVRDHEVCAPIFSIVPYESALGSLYPDITICVDLPQEKMDMLAGLRQIPYAVKFEDESLNLEELQPFVACRVDDDEDEAYTISMKTKLGFLDAATREIMFYDILDIPSDMQCFRLDVAEDGSEAFNPVKGSDLKVDDVVIATRKGKDESEVVTYAKVIAQGENVEPPASDTTFVKSGINFKVDWERAEGETGTSVIAADDNIIVDGKDGMLVSKVCGNVEFPFTATVPGLGEVSILASIPAVNESDDVTWVQYEGIDGKRRTAVVPNETEFAIAWEGTEEGEETAVLATELVSGSTVIGDMDDGEGERSIQLHTVTGNGDASLQLTYCYNDCVEQSITVHARELVLRMPDIEQADRIELIQMKDVRVGDVLFNQSTDNLQLYKVLTVTSN